MAEAINPEFNVNEHITLRLENNKTIIYIDGKKFIQCKFLLLDIPVDDVKSLNEIDSVDEAAEKLNADLEPVHSFRIEKIPPEIEFWGHCSNLQVWIENNYDTRLLHRNLAFPLLRKLANAGDSLAKKMFKDEITKRLESGNRNVIEYLLSEGYIDFFSIEEQKILFAKGDILVQEYFLRNLTDEEFFNFLEFLNEEELKAIIKRGWFDFIIIRGKSYIIENNELCLNGEDIGRLKEIKEIKGLEKHTELERLIINGNDIREIKGLETLINLKELYLYDNKITKIDGLNTLRNLEVLHLSGNNIIEIKGLENLTKLKKLYLSDNKIIEIKNLESLINLEKLQLDNNQIFEIKGLETLKKLMKFSIEYNSIPNDLLDKLGGLKDGIAKDPDNFIEFCLKIKKTHN